VKGNLARLSQGLLVQPVTDFRAYQSGKGTGAQMKYANMSMKGWNPTLPIKERTQIKEL
jgi:hypothetical protein